MQKGLLIYLRTFFKSKLLSAMLWGAMRARQQLPPDKNDCLENKAHKLHRTRLETCKCLLSLQKRLCHNTAHIPGNTLQNRWLLSAMLWGAMRAGQVMPTYNFSCLDSKAHKLRHS